MQCENPDCDSTLTPHQVADGESFCSDECGEYALRTSKYSNNNNPYSLLWDDIDDDEDEDEWE